jgi:D-alanyl-D-alanine carboxypeptidase
MFLRLALGICALMVSSAGGQTAVTALPIRADAASVIEKLSTAYPTLVRSDNDKQIIINTTSMAVDQKRSPKTFEQRLDQADLVDQLSIPYPTGCPARTPAVNEDPGRLRFDPFFAAMYGNSAKSITKNLTTIKWFGRNIQVSTVNGVDKALAAVAADLAVLIAKQPDLRKYVTPTAGTYNFRTIAGTKRLSMHAYGIAIDLNTAYSDYWRWNGKGTPPVYRNRIPCEIGEAFERHGFIWGAKWYHYDSMHFEYRPELLP